MSDFEVHPRGTAEEIKLSRELSNAIQQQIDTWGERIISHDILQAYKRLYGLYIKQQQHEDITHE